MVKRTEKLTKRAWLEGEDLKLHDEALEQFAQSGTCETFTSDVLCNRCGKPIVFVQVTPSAVSYDCGCGKFKGAIRGL